MRARLCSIPILALLACGSAGSAVRPVHPSSPFTDADQQLFEDGVDMVGDPEGLTGRWADEWALEMRDRVQRSDLVALVTVNTMRTDINPQQRTTHWLLAQIGDVLKGKVDGSELALATSQSSRGFESVDQERTGILRRPLLVLGKWAETPEGEVQVHWHLALASTQVVAVVRKHLEDASSASQSQSRTIIERH
jgi:hypothetical protein